MTHRAVAQFFGASDYVGVDLDPGTQKKTWRGEYSALSDDPDFTARYFKSDILTFLRRLKDPGPLFVRIEGLEVYYYREDNVTPKAYLHECMKELMRVMCRGDVLSVGPDVSFLHPLPTNPAADVFYTLDPAEYGFYLLEGAPREYADLSSDEYLWVKM